MFCFLLVRVHLQLLPRPLVTRLLQRPGYGIEQTKRLPIRPNCLAETCFIFSSGCRAPSAVVLSPAVEKADAMM